MPGKIVVVFSMNEPENDFALPVLIGKAKELFEDQPEVSVYAGIRDAADEVLAIFEQLAKTKEEEK